MGQFEVFATGVHPEDETELTRSELFCLWQGLSSVEEMTESPESIGSPETALEDFGRLFGRILFGTVGLTLYCTADRDQPLAAADDGEADVLLGDIDPAFVDWLVCQVDAVSGGSAFMSLMLFDAEYSAAMMGAFLSSADADAVSLFDSESLAAQHLIESPVYQPECGLPPAFASPPAG